jgi:hypothetical protein
MRRSREATRRADASKRVWRSRCAPERIANCQAHVAVLAELTPPVKLAKKVRWRKEIFFTGAVTM